MSLCVAATPALQLDSDDLKWIRVAFVVVFVILSLALHEAAHAWVAWKCGDPTAKDLGRITLNPLPSIDPVLTIVLPVMTSILGMGAFGGAKPVPVDMRRLRHPLRDMMLVALAGPATNFLLAILFDVAWKLAVRVGNYHHSDLLPTVLEYALFSNLLLAVFNMLPIPPLDGSRVMTWLLPSGLREPYVRIESFGIIAVLLVVKLVPGMQSLIWGGVDQLHDFVDILTFGTW